jgi:hypothetical protein
MLGPAGGEGSFARLVSENPKRSHHAALRGYWFISSPSRLSTSIRGDRVQGSTTRRCALRGYPASLIVSEEHQCAAGFNLFPEYPDLLDDATLESLRPLGYIEQFRRAS